MTQTMGSRFRKFFAAIMAVLMTLCLTTTMTFASSRKLITKTVSGSMTVYSAYHYNYSFNASAVLTYNGSSISQISDLSLGYVSYTASQPSLAATFVARQSSKANMGSYAKYVVTLTRTIYGYYTDKVDYTLTYRPSDAGTPYSVGGNDDQDFVVEVEVSDPYDIQFLKDVN